MTCEEDGVHAKRPPRSLAAQNVSMPFVIFNSVALREGANEVAGDFARGRWAWCRR